MVKMEIELRRFHMSLGKFYEDSIHEWWVVEDPITKQQVVEVRPKWKALMGCENMSQDRPLAAGITR
jgi:hypothetical protein